MSLISPVSHGPFCGRAAPYFYTLHQPLWQIALQHPFRLRYQESPNCRYRQLKFLQHSQGQNLLKEGVDFGRGYRPWLCQHQCVFHRPWHVCKDHVFFKISPPYIPCFIESLDPGGYLNLPISWRRAAVFKKI